MILNNKTTMCLPVLLLLASLALVINCFHHHHGPEFIELSYAINNETLHWVSLQDVSYRILTSGPKSKAFNKNETYYVKSDRLEMDLHSGTHMDAPIHFAQDKWSIDKIPLDRLVNVPAYVIDLSDKVTKNRTYQFTREDLEEFENKSKSKIANNSVVLIYTGISEFWSKGASDYFGSDTKNLSDLKIPGFTKEAALFLVDNRAVIGVGLDAPSADGSSSIDSENNMDPIAHVIFCNANVYILENVSSNLKQLINATSIRLSALPLPIETASGSPVRLVAQTNDKFSGDHYSLHQTSGAAPSATAAVNFNFICMFVCLMLTSTMMHLR